MADAARDAQADGWWGLSQFVSDAYNAARDATVAAGTGLATGATQAANWTYETTTYAATQVGNAAIWTAGATWYGMQATGSFVYETALVPIGQLIAYLASALWKGASAVGQAILSGLTWGGQQIAWVAGVAWQGMVWLANRGWELATTLGTLAYQYILTPIGNGIAVACRAIWQAALKIGQAVGLGLVMAATALWHGVAWVARVTATALKALGNRVWRAILVPLGQAIAAAAKALWEAAKVGFNALVFGLRKGSDMLWRALTSAWAGIRAIAEIAWLALSTLGNLTYQKLLIPIGRALATFLSATWALTRQAGRLLIDGLSWTGATLVWAGGHIWDGVVWLAGVTWAWATAIGRAAYRNVLAPMASAIAKCVVTAWRAAVKLSKAAWQGLKWIGSGVARGFELTARAVQHIASLIWIALSTLGVGIYNHLLTPLGHAIARFAKQAWKLASQAGAALLRGLQKVGTLLCRGLTWMANTTWWALTQLGTTIYSKVLVPLGNLIAATARLAWNLASRLGQAIKAGLILVANAFARGAAFVWRQVSWAAQVAWQWLATISQAVYENILVPLGHGIGQVAQTCWHAVKRVGTALATGLQWLGEALLFLTEKALMAVEWMVTKAVTGIAYVGTKLQDAAIYIRDNWRSILKHLAIAAIFPVAIIPFGIYKLGKWCLGRDSNSTSDAAPTNTPASPDPNPNAAPTPLIFSSEPKPADRATPGLVACDAAQDLGTDNLSFRFTSQ